MQPRSTPPTVRWPAPGATLAVGGGLQVVAVVPISDRAAWIEGVVEGAAVAGVVSNGADALHGAMIAAARKAPTISAALCLADVQTPGAQPGGVAAMLPSAASGGATSGAPMARAASSEVPAAASIWGEPAGPTGGFAPVAQGGQNASAADGSAPIGAATSGDDTPPAATDEPADAPASAAATPTPGIAAVTTGEYVSPVGPGEAAPRGVSGDQTAALAMPASAAGPTVAAGGSPADVAAAGDGHGGTATPSEAQIGAGEPAAPAPEPARAVQGTPPSGDEQAAEASEASRTAAAADASDVQGALAGAAAGAADAPQPRSGTAPLNLLTMAAAAPVAPVVWHCTLWDRPLGRPLDLVLYEDTAERLVPEVVERIRRLGVPLIEALARLHGDGLVAGIALPAQVQLTDEGCRLLGVGLQCVDGPRLVMPGHAAPECVGRGAGIVDARTDVFFAGTVLHRLLTGSGPYAEASELHLGLPAPQILRDELPAELCAVVRRACSPLPGRRYVDAVALLGALDAALATLERRRMASRSRVWLDVGHELHIGVLKGHYAPINQDDVFLAYEPEDGIGLFLVTDGVSISTYGTGDQASTCVRLAAVDTWSRIMKAGADAGLGRRPKLPLPGEPRRALMRGLLDQANAAIGRKVEASGHRFSGPPEGVMAATTVAVLVEDNHATLMSIGDSRIYLVRDGHIASLMVDHDLGTQLIRLGRSPTEARATPSSGALIRCVGEFDVTAEGTLRPVPLQPDFREMRLLPGDALLLCSDGLPDYGGYDLEHAEDRIREVMESAPGARWAAFELMVLANRGGGGDNISCIVLRVVAPEDGGAS